MNPLSREEADLLLAEAPLLPYAKASLAEGRAMVQVLLSRGVPALVRRPDDCCGGGGCGPSFEVVVREEDVPRIASLQRERWEEALAREGLTPVAGAASETEEPPCPACGTVGPLVEGACGDCGLQLE